VGPLLALLTAVGGADVPGQAPIGHTAGTEAAKRIVMIADADGMYCLTWCFWWERAKGIEPS
jgi:hypothetical protein